MKEKIISWILGAILGWAIVFSYGYFTNSDTLNIHPNWVWMPSWNFWSWTFDTSNMSDEQLEMMAKRAWISTDELKIKLENWEDMRTLMWWRWTWRWENSSWTVQ